MDINFFSPRIIQQNNNNNLEQTSLTTSKYSSKSESNMLETALHTVKTKVQNGDVDGAINYTVDYIMNNANTPKEKSKLQDTFNKEMGGINARGNFYQFCYKLANSEKLQQFKPDNTPSLFHPMCGETLYAAADHRNTNPLEAYFNRHDIKQVLTSGFSCVSDETKLAIKTISSLAGKLLDSHEKAIGGCFRISEDIVIMPLHCAQNITNCTVQFLSPDLQPNITCHITSILEKYENIDIAVVQLKESQEPVNIKYSDSTLDGERLFLLHYPNSTTGQSLQVSGHNCQLSATWDGYSLVTNHDSSPGSSGGIYINSNGEIVGLHIGAYGSVANMSGAEKYAYRLSGLSTIIDAESKLYDFLTPEGDKSKPELLGLLEEVANGTIAIPDGIAIGVAEKATIRAWCATPKTYKNTVIEHMKIHCNEADNDPIKLLVLSLVDSSPNILGKADNYGSVQRNWGVGYAVECDHLLPKFVLKPHPLGTNNTTVRSFGVNGLPALAIEYRKHRNLSTTSNDTTFSSELVELCNQHKIPEALAKVLNDYENNGLLTIKYKAGLLKLFNTPGQYYHDMVEKDILASGMSVTDATHCRSVMNTCIAKIQSIA